MSLIVPLVLLLQETSAPASDAPAPSFAPPGVEESVDVPADAPDDTAAEAERLRSRIHDMRMNLLLGGDRVRAAESQAKEFYGRRAAFVESRIDRVDSDLTELRASYELALERSLGAETGDKRKAAFREAQPLRTRITELEAEAAELDEKRDRLDGLVASIAARDDERARLVEELESSAAVPDALGMPSLGIGLAPPPLPAEPSSPLEDTELLADLFERDPEAARSLVWDLDPVRYWEVFPLEPPAEVIADVLDFPPLDLDLDD